MSSQAATDGRMTLTVTFAQGTDPDIAQVQVQNRVNLALPLPTRIVIGLSELLKKGWWVMIVGGYTGFQSFKRYYATPNGKLRIDKLMLGFPVLGDVPGLGALFQQRNRRFTKSEIVILLKPTIIHSDRNWQQDLTETRERLRMLKPGSPPQPIHLKLFVAPVA